MKLYGAVCHKKGTPISKGFNIDGIVYSKINYADEFCKNKFGVTFSKLRDEVNFEFGKFDCAICEITEWNNDDIMKQGYAYDENSDVIYLYDEPRKK